MILTSQPGTLTGAYFFNGLTSVTLAASPPSFLTSLVSALIVASPLAMHDPNNLLSVGNTVWELLPVCLVGLLVSLSEK